MPGGPIRERKSQPGPRRSSGARQRIPLMTASGANVKMVQSQLVHKTATMPLDQYGHLFPDDLDDVADKINVLLREVPKSAHQGRT